MASNINEVKSIIRGLLTSCPEEMTVGKLRHDYRNQEGQDIPFYEYKFHDVTSFLRSIPDVCQVCDNPCGVQPIVRLVESEKSAHISSLVMRQRPSGKGRSKRSNITVHGRPSYKVSHMKKSSKPAVHRIPHSEGSQSSIKSKIFYRKSLSNVCAPDLNTSTTERAITNHVTSWDAECEELSGNYGNQGSIPIAKEECEDFSSIVELHLNQVLRNHEGIGLHELEGYLWESLSSHGFEIPLDKDSIEEIIGRMVDFTIKDNKVFSLNSCALSTSENFPDLTAVKYEEDTSTEMNREEIGNSCVEDDLTKGSSYPFISSDSNDNFQRLESNLYFLLKDCPTGILLSQLAEKYKLKFAAPLNFQILGCKSVNELVSKMKYLFSSVTLEDNDIKLFPSELYVPKFPSKSISCSKSKKIDIPILIKRNIQWLMQGYPNGLHSAEFEQTYKDTFYGEIDISEMGFSTLLEFLNVLELEGIIQTCISDSDTWLLPSQSPLESFGIHDPLPLLSRESEEDLCLLKEKFPNDVVGPDINIEQEIIPSWIEKGSMIEIYIQELHSPENFWVSFVGEECTSALETLMDDLQVFYCTKSQSYKMPYEVVRKGQVCAAQYNGEWNRARVMRLVDSSEVEVLFFDYGTQSFVQRNSLYYLHTSFSKLPAQAIRAVMANIAPIDAVWSKDASKRFLSLIADRPLIGIVHNVDRQNCILSLFLCDTNGNDDIYIGDVLVAEGYAREANSNEEEFSGEINKDMVNGAISNGNSSRDEAVDTTKSISIKNANFIAEDMKNDSFALEDHLLLSPSEQLSLENGANNLESPIQLDYMSISSQQIQSKFDSPSDVASSVETSYSNSNSLADKVFTSSVSVGPPPGFCHSMKMKGLVAKTDKSKSCDNSFSTDKEKFCNCDNSFTRNKEKVCNCDNKEHPAKEVINESSLKNMKYSTKSVNSGVNANFPEEFKTYPGTTTDYMGWSSPVFPTTPTFHPPFVPLDARVHSPHNPMGYPFPNPIDFYTLWHYEQMRQQAIIRGAFAHFNNVLPQLPGGLNILPNQTVRPQINASPQMHISELQSPPLRVEKTEISASFASTQTDDLFNDISSQASENDSYKSARSACKPESSTGDSAKGACKELNGNLSEGDYSYAVSDINLNNPMFLESKTFSIQSPSHSLYNFHLGAHNNENNAIDIGENKNSERTLLPKYGCFQPSKSENKDKLCGEEKSSPVKEINGENNPKGKAIDTFYGNAHGVQDEIDYFNRENECQDNKLDFSCHSSPSTVELNGKNPFKERGLVNEKCTSPWKVTEKNLESNENDKSSDIVLNPFLTSASYWEANKDNLPPSAENGEFNVELSPFAIKKGNDSVLPLEKQTLPNSTEIPNGKGHSILEECDDDDMKSSLTQMVANILDEPDNVPWEKGQPDVRSVNQQNTVSTKQHYGSETTSELLDNFKSVSISDSVKRSHSLDDSEVLYRKRNDSHHLNKNSALHLNQGRSSSVAGVYGTKLHTEDTEDKVKGYQVALKLDKETKSNAIQHKFPYTSLKRAVKTITSDTSLQNSDALSIRGCVEDASLKSKNTPVLESTASSWTTTWSTDRITPSPAPKATVKPTVKPTVTDSVLQNSKKGGGMESHDFIPVTRDDSKLRFVKKIELLEHNIHLINMDGRPHVPTDEIVRNFTSFNGHHVVLKILDARKININFLELCRKRRPDIFECLDKTDMKFVSRNHNGNIIGSLHTIPLRSVPYMLKALNRDNSVITEAVQEALANFDANDPYWKGRFK